MKVLVGCEYSGVVRDAFIRRGHDAMSCDLLPTESEGPHHQGDVFDVLDWDWDLAVFHWPCTYLTNSGVRWLHENTDRWALMEESAHAFRRLLDAPIPCKALENPIMHRYALQIVGRRADQVVQPWMFGHPERKATCFWLDGLPLLQPTHDVRREMVALPEREQQRLHYLPPSADRWKERSKTFSGIAEAMAAQWGDGEMDLFAGAQ